MTKNSQDRTCATARLTMVVTAILVVLLSVSITHAQGNGPGFHVSAGGDLNCPGGQTLSQATAPLSLGPLTIPCTSGQSIAAAEANTAKVRARGRAEHMCCGTASGSNGSARIQFDNVVVSGPAAASIPVSMNFRLKGTLNGNTDLGQHGLFLFLRLAGMSTDSKIEANHLGIINQSGVFAPLTIGFPNATIDQTFVTPTGNVAPNQPLRFDIQLGAASAMAGVGFTEVDFFSGSNGFFLPVGTPVFNLPPGYTINIPELNIVNNLVVTPGVSTIQFLSPTTVVNEGSVGAVVTVTRSGDTSAPATVDYTTADTDNFTVGCADTLLNLGGAFARCDFALSLDTITFAAGETSKTFIVPIIDDSHAEGTESFPVVLSNPTGATLGNASTATVSITDNDTVTGPNPILNTPFFVRQHYLDFLSREPDTPGFNAWVNVLNNCSDLNNNPVCDRILVSSSFFGSQEFQLKGYFVYRFYKLAFNRLPTYSEIVTNMRVVTGQTANEVFQKKAAFTNAFAQLPEFTNQYGGMNNSQYVSTLMNRYSLTQITTPDPAAPDDANKVTLTTTELTNRLTAGTLTRAQVLRAIADSDQVFNAEFDAAFVAMQYFGYLRRTPDPPGFSGWLSYLNTHPGDFRTMVNGFLNSVEYRLRFGP